MRVLVAERRKLGARTVSELIDMHQPTKGEEGAKRTAAQAAAAIWRRKTMAPPPPPSLRRTQADCGTGPSPSEASDVNKGAKPESSVAFKGGKPEGNTVRSDASSVLRGVLDFKKKAGKSERRPRELASQSSRSSKGRRSNRDETPKLEEVVKRLNENAMVRSLAGKFEIFDVGFWWYGVWQLCVRLLQTSLLTFFRVAAVQATFASMIA